jgi:hypothetical protein
MNRGDKIILPQIPELNIDPLSSRCIATALGNCGYFLGQ